LKKQFRELTPEINQSDSTSVAGIPIKAFALKHLSFYRDSVDLEEYMYNACYLIGMDGIRVFHSGDIKRNALESYLAENKRWTDSIDVAFLYFELFDSGKTDLDYVVKTLNPRYIVVMHVPPRMMDEWTEKIAELRRYFPNILLFRNSLDSQVIDVTGSKHNDKSKEIEK
jgi:L-ascorbate metabolism protein UlaG (beta-lactamase superfamily)